MSGTAPATSPAASPGRDQRQAALEALRDRFLVHCWAYSRMALNRGLFMGRDDSAEMCSNTCRATSVFLRQVMGEAGGAWRTVEGTLQDVSGNPQYHVWLCNGHEILDLTAAQFGWRTDALIVRADDARYTAAARQPTQAATARKCATMIERWTTGRGATHTSDSHPLLVAVRERLDEIDAFGQAWARANTPAPDRCVLGGGQVPGGRPRATRRR